MFVLNIKIINSRNLPIKRNELKQYEMKASVIKTIYFKSLLLIIMDFLNMYGKVNC